MSDPREFKNEFNDYSGESLLTDEGNFKDQAQTKLRAAIQHLLQIIESRDDLTDSRDYSVYTGTTGFALLHLHLSSKLGSSSQKFHLTKAWDWLQIALKRLKGSRFSFLCGDGGPLAIAAVICKKTENEKSYQDYVSQLEEMTSVVCRNADIPDEVLYGRCGFLSSLLFVQKHCGTHSIKRECIIQVVQSILRSGERLSRSQRCSHPLMYEWHDKAYLGAAHGLAGIYFMLLQVQEPTLQEEIHQKVRPCIDYMLSLQFPSGNCPSSIGSSTGDKLVHWCHGAPGWIYMFVLAYKIFKDKRYLQAAKDCADVIWKRGLLRKGYGICHGTAGNAYAFLTMYKQTSEAKYIFYAYKFAEWCCDYGKHGCRTPDKPYSMFEGMAGTVYFLSDLLKPSDSAFPTFEFNLY